MDGHVHDLAYLHSDATATNDDNNPNSPTTVMAYDPEHQVYAPPPHLAARFYRDRASARRKSSAASSRRNSISSAQSHASSRSHRRSSAVGLGSQSNYIAQHLRRNSIIESRRARLADRAAHAEQVRVRAALAKSAPRGSISVSEERALAAQLAKEKYLAKVAATCAEEVARAKRIAEEVRERKLAEETRARLEMEEKYAEVEKRRTEYQRNLQARRARRADSAEKKLAVVEELADGVDDDLAVLDPETAVRRIQRAWRNRRRKAVITLFETVEMSLKDADETSFEDMTARIAKPHVISATTALLTHFGLQEAFDDNAALNTRTFLSAYLIIGNAEATLNKNGAQEQDLIAKATDLLYMFESTLTRLASWNDYKPEPTQLETISQSYSTYTSAFAAWRLQDSSVLIEGMIASFVELDAIWQTVKDDSHGEVSSEYREGIRDNQVMLLSRIRKLAGPERADVLIKKAIRESRKKRPKKRNAAEVRPRGVGATTIESSQSEPELAASEQVINAVVPPPDLSSSDISRTLFTNMPSNRVLAHELAINKDYRLTHSGAQAAIRDEIYRSVCGKMKAAFEAGDGKLWTLRTASNIRERLLRMLKPGNSMYTLISENLDLDQIARQYEAGVFSYDGFFNFMANILPKLCAPYRDAEIATLCQIFHSTPDGPEVDVMIMKLSKLMRAVDMLSLDYSNFMIGQAAPVLIREAPGYEQRTFSADLEAGRITLDRTKRWWRASHNALRLETDRRNPESINGSENLKPEKVYATALVDLAIEQGMLEDTEIPEVLRLDSDRLRDIRSKAVHITVIGAVLLTAKNLLKRDVRGQWKTEASRIWQLLASESLADSSSGLSAAQKAFSVLETAHNMPPPTKSQLSGTISRFFAQGAAVTTSASARFTDPVLKVLFQRLRTHILTRLTASTSAERVRAASSATEALTSCGLGELTAQVGAMVDLLEKVRVVDRQSHDSWYEAIIKELATESDS